MTKTVSTNHGSTTRAEITLGKRPGIDYKKALAPQSGEARGRSQTRITETKNGLKITISAEDPTALRASINSIMREIQVLDSAVNLNLKNRGSGFGANKRKNPMKVPTSAKGKGI